MSRFRNILRSSEPVQAQGEWEYITPPYGNNMFERIGSGKDRLVSELENLYWLGAKAELENIVTSLREWRHSEGFSNAQTHNELKVPDALEGYDFFIDSVSQWTREYAFKYGS